MEKIKDGGDSCFRDISRTSVEQSVPDPPITTGICDSDSDSSDEEVTFEELADSYKKLCIRSAEVCQQNERQTKLIIKLEAEKRADLETISHLEGEVQMLNSKLDQMTKFVTMLTNGTDKLEEILQVGKNVGDKSGLEFVAAKKSFVDNKKIRPDK